MTRIYHVYSGSHICVNFRKIFYCLKRERAREKEKI